MLRVFETAASALAFASTSLRLHRTLALDRAVSAASKTVRDWSCLLAYPSVSLSLFSTSEVRTPVCGWPGHPTGPPRPSFIPLPIIMPYGGEGIPLP
ncbi:hypothetical protein CGCA056_v003626 [Colletotrichum aenigma]|uniref:uncharacterized protein n=1 Tax=Colletotrichum aenigma TaxID=1215731 RepID=UPI00187261D2|nr:uncharacterized protein CGCA056_v003626 [Colletotrichum aenigma]KAF5526322.1 hypothetical protein CGCA056_v003626 [Colletotrichum aenigma]